MTIFFVESSDFQAGANSARFCESSNSATSKVNTWNNLPSECKEVVIGDVDKPVQVVLVIKSVAHFYLFTKLSTKEPPPSIHAKNVLPHLLFLDSYFICQRVDTTQKCLVVGEVQTDPRGELWQLSGNWKVSVVPHCQYIYLICTVDTLEDEPRKTYRRDQKTFQPLSTEVALRGSSYVHPASFRNCRLASQTSLGHHLTSGNNYSLSPPRIVPNCPFFNDAWRISSSCQTNGFPIVHKVWVVPQPK